MKTAARLVWVINLKALIGRRVRIETFDGHYREGVVAAIEWATLKMLGMDWDYPAAIRFELDDADGIPWAQIKAVELVRVGHKVKRTKVKAKKAKAD